MLLVLAWLRLDRQRGWIGSWIVDNCRQRRNGSLDGAMLDEIYAVLEFSKFCRR